MTFNVVGNTRPFSAHYLIHFSNLKKETMAPNPLVTKDELTVITEAYDETIDNRGSGKSVAMEKNSESLLNDEEDVVSSGPDPEFDSSSSEQEDRNLVIAKQENKNVARSKGLVIMFLLVAAGVVSFFTYYFLQQNEIEDFETQYHDFQTEIVVSANSNAEDFLGKLLTLSNTITSSSLQINATWPNVTMKNWDILASGEFEQSVGPELFLFAPLVPDDLKDGWEEYAVQNQGWIKEDLALRGIDVDPGNISDEIFAYNYDKESAMSVTFSLPLWQMGPVPTTSNIIMMDLYTQASFRRIVDDAFLVNHILLSEIVDRTFFWDDIEIYGESPTRLDDPRSFAIQPVYASFEPNASITGFVFAIIPWDTYFEDVLPRGVEGFVVQVNDTCGSKDFAYRLDGPAATFLGKGFEPDQQYNQLSETFDFAAFTRFDEIETENEAILHCAYTISVHATASYATSFETTKPLNLTLTVLTVFAFTAMVFVLYDFMVQKRQEKVMKAAQNSTAFVSSLFPKNVRNRILAAAMEDEDIPFGGGLSTSGKDKLRSFFNGGEESNSKSGTGFSKPIADFFPDTTIMFADIVGFTAWSSTREPSQVFTLLETIYNEFDKAAKARRVFKVETVGDCYVAVAGLPDPRKDHAVVMARFAVTCLKSLHRMTKELEVILGPDTADLSMRVGLHTGPVTAGVLRGERARFQLFGDTMNTASRMESTGVPDQIQVSSDFVKCLEKAGKSQWVVPRADKVFVKGKGELQTFFLNFEKDNHSHCTTVTSGRDGGRTDLARLKSVELSTNNVDLQFSGKNDLRSARLKRLVSWNVDLLGNILKEIIASRLSSGLVPDSDIQLTSKEEEFLVKRVGNAITEVQEIIHLPPYKKGKLVEPRTIVLKTKVLDQLKQYINSIAQLYKENPFHNFEHASHVTMSVVKLLSRIIAPDVDKLGSVVDDQHLHDHTYGITSDPLTRFSVIVSALIHDADHPGVPNFQLIKEKSSMAELYKNKSIAEQNSVDLAWELLMEPCFKDLRRCIYQTERELVRFRQLIVNTVLATDIMDKDLKMVRNQKWDKAFKAVEKTESQRETVNRKATIVIEHLIQASDVAHTMQHWHIYRKWNGRLFEEMYKAYIEGRSEKDPTESWYEGEIGFFDFYIIPLAKKLKDCGVFGVSSDEYLQYAMNNRNEWEAKGQEIAKELSLQAQSNPICQKETESLDEIAD